MNLKCSSNIKVGEKRWPIREYNDGQLIAIALAKFIEIMGLVKISAEPFSREPFSRNEQFPVQRIEPQGQQILVRSASVSQVYSLSAELLKTVDAESLKSFQWYFERYTLDEPFAYTQARVIQRRLRNQGRLLLKEFLLPDICPQPNSSNDFLIEIVSTDDTSSRDCPLHQFFWEVLEDGGLWYDVFRTRPRSVTVVRVCRQNGTSGADAGAEQASPNVTSRMKNVLAVTARPSHTTDIPHRLITRSISAAVCQSPTELKPSASLEIVRPGTFDALAKHLAQHDKGHFGIVHLDLRGGTDTQGYVCY